MAVQFYSNRADQSYNPSEDDVGQGLFATSPEDQDTSRKFLSLSNTAKLAGDAAAHLKKPLAKTGMLNEEDLPPVNEQTAPQITKIMKNPDLMDNVQSLFQGDDYVNFTLPFLGIVEAIATQGKSPGTAALNVRNQVLGERKMKIDEAEHQADMLDKKEDRNQKIIERKMITDYRNDISQLDPNDPEYAQKVAKIGLKYTNDPEKAAVLLAKTKRASPLTTEEMLDLKKAFPTVGDITFSNDPENWRKQLQSYTGKNQLAGSQQSSTPFEVGSPDYKNAEYIANNNIPPSKWIVLFPGWGSKGARGKVFSTIRQINPNYQWIDSEENFTERMSQALRLGGLTPNVIRGEAQKSGQIALAKLSPEIISGEAQKSGQIALAKLSPEIIGARAGAAAANKSAVNNQVKVDNANAANILFRKVLTNGFIDENKIQSMSPVNIGELFMATAKLLNSQGVLSDKQLAEVSQPTLKGNIARLTQFFGDQYGGATTDDVLENMFDLIQREGRQAQRAKASAVSGSAQDFQQIVPQSKFIAGKTYTDARGNKAIYNQDGTFTEVK